MPSTKSHRQALVVPTEASADPQTTPGARLSPGALLRQWCPLQGAPGLAALTPGLPSTGKSRERIQDQKQAASQKARPPTNQ